MKCHRTVVSKYRLPWYNRVIIHTGGAILMTSYFKLWRLLDKRGYQRKDIVRLAGISESTYRKLLANEAVRMDVLQRICVALNVDVGDICSFRL